MKVVGFVGSPRKGGNTDILVQKALEGAKEKGAETKIYYLNDMNIKGCQACMACKTKTDTCVQKDDMAPLYKEIAEADGVVIGSPIYMGNITGQAKVFLDRWYALVTGDYKSRLAPGKKALVILPQGQPDANLFAGVGKSIGGVLKFLVKVDSDTLIAPGVRDKGAVANNAEILDKAQQAGAKLIS